MLPVLLLMDFSDPGLDKHPAMTIPCRSQQPAVNHLGLISEPLSNKKLFPGRGQEALKTAQKWFLAPSSPVSSGTWDAAVGRQAKELWVFSLCT